MGGEAHSSKQNFTFQSDLQTNDTELVMQSYEDRSQAWTLRERS